jgi:hypothetical protein
MAETEVGEKRIIRRGPYPELTLTSVLVGYVLGVLITISMGYACLILGFSHEGSELAAILGFGVLRGILRRNSIIENNISQTVASSVNGASAGIMFSVPALFILGETDFNPYLMTFGCIRTTDLSWRGCGRDCSQVSRCRSTKSQAIGSRMLAQCDIMPDAENTGSMEFA